MAGSITTTVLIYTHVSSGGAKRCGDAASRARAPRLFPSAVSAGAAVADSV